MALVTINAGDPVAHANIDQIIDLLKGVMHDQPVTLKGDYSVVGPSLTLSSLTAATKGGALGFADAGTLKWELYHHSDQALHLWDSARATDILIFASNGDITLPSPAKLLGSADFRTSQRIIAGADPGGGSSGDMIANRGGGSPGSGAIFFGSSGGSHYLYYDGTKFNLTDGLAMSGALSGVTSLAMSGALTGATTGAFSGQLTYGNLVAGGGSQDNAETTASTTPVDLTTVGPSVTLTTGTQVLCSISMSCSSNTANAIQIMGVACSGATTFAANSSNDHLLRLSHATVNGIQQAANCFLITGLTAGSNTFTAKYWVNAGTGTFQYRTMSVVCV